MPEVREQMGLGVADIANNVSDNIETVARFSNTQLPRKASQNADNLGAVCCPSFSLS
jgi:hypothetical protein